MGASITLDRSLIRNSASATASMISAVDGDTSMTSSIWSGAGGSGDLLVNGRPLGHVDGAVRLPVHTVGHSNSSPLTPARAATAL